MTGALVTVRGALRLPSLRRIIPAFLAFSITEWASWIGLVVFAYARGGAVEAGVVAGVVFIPSIIVAPAASMFGDRWPRARVLTGAYGILAASMAATAVALVLAPPIIAYAVATLAATSITLIRPAHAALLPDVAQTPDEHVEALTLAQRLAGDDVMSRVFGVMESTMMASQAVGALAVPVLIATVGMLPAIVVSGVALGVIVATAAPTLIRADSLDPARLRRLRTLRGVPMFGPLFAPVLERLANGATSLSIDPGRAIVTAGEVGDRFYVITSGDVEVTTPSGVVRRQTSGDSFGEIALLRDIPRTATVVATSPTELLAVDRGPFLEALTGQPRSRALADAASRRRLDSDIAAETGTV
jgi:MFS family permease